MYSNDASNGQSHVSCAATGPGKPQQRLIERLLCGSRQTYTCHDLAVLQNGTPFGLQALLEAPPRQRRLVERSLLEVDAALQQPTLQRQRQPPGAAAAGAGSGAGGETLERTEASSDAAMQSLLVRFLCD